VKLRPSHESVLIGNTGSRCQLVVVDLFCGSGSEGSNQTAIKATAKKYAKGDFGHQALANRSFESLADESIIRFVERACSGIVAVTVPPGRLEVASG